MEGGPMAGLIELEQRGKEKYPGFFLPSQPLPESSFSPINVEAPDIGAWEMQPARLNRAVRIQVQRAENGPCGHIKP